MAGWWWEESDEHVEVEEFTNFENVRRGAEQPLPKALITVISMTTHNKSEATTPPPSSKSFDR
jgi:hypothetical protein